MPASLGVGGWGTPPVQEHVAQSDIITPPSPSPDHSPVHFPMTASTLVSELVPLETKQNEKQPSRSGIAFVSTALSLCYEANHRKPVQSQGSAPSSL